MKIKSHRNNLPEYRKYVANYYVGCNAVHDLFDTDGKYRKRRNDIAHNASRFRESSYLEFKSKAEDALEELILFLDIK